MKKITLIALGALALTACNNSYKISGTTAGDKEGTMAYLVNTNTNEAIDSCVVADSAFAFAGELAEPEILRVQIGRASGSVLVEPTSQISIDFTQSPAKVADNGGINDKSLELNEVVKAKYNELREAYSEMLQKAHRGEIPVEEAYAYADKATVEINNLYNEYITANKDNILGAYIMSMAARSTYTDYATLDSAMNAVKYASKIASLNRLRENLEKKEKTKEGNMFVDFKGLSVDGNESSLSDYVGKGKFVIADFWASWCGPCRGEIPNLIAVNKEFGGDNFVVLGINVWDQEQKFKESLKNEGIDYPQIYVPANSETSPTDLYGIDGIPQIMLFGPDGTIIKRNLRGEGIRNAVVEAMGK